MSEIDVNAAYAAAAKCEHLLQGVCLTCVGVSLAAAEERGRDELRAALKAAENDRDTWKRLCEKADAQATAATVRANKLAAKRGYDLDDDSEERGRRRGVEGLTDAKALLTEIRHELLRMDGGHGSIAELPASLRRASTVARLSNAIRALDAALAPRDSGKEG